MTTDFARKIVRFRATDMELLADFLEDALEMLGVDVDPEERRVIEDLLEAIEDCDSIEIVDAEEFLEIAD